MEENIMTTNEMTAMDMVNNNTNVGFHKRQVDRARLQGIAIGAAGATSLITASFGIYKLVGMIRGEDTVDVSSDEILTSDDFDDDIDDGDDDFTPEEMQAEKQK